MLTPILKGSHHHIYPCTNSASLSPGNTFILKHLSLESEKTVASPPCQLALGFTMKVRVWVASLTTEMPVTANLTTAGWFKKLLHLLHTE